MRLLTTQTKVHSHQVQNSPEDTATHDMWLEQILPTKNSGHFREIIHPYEVPMYIYVLFK